MFGSAHIPFDGFPGKFIMQVQELCADTERGWKQTGHVREDQTILSERQREDDPDLHLSESIRY